MHITDVPIFSFDSPNKWHEWLQTNHTQPKGVWIRFFKKNAHVSSMTYTEAVDEALCYGWIDSQAKKYDEMSYIQKFTPRRTKSIWSKINRERIEKLITAGKMQASGLKQVEEAKKDGRWDHAYDSPRNMTLPEDFLKALSQNKQAKAFFETLNKTNTYAIMWRLQTAKKPETRAKRMTLVLEMLAKGEKFHP